MVNFQVAPSLALVALAALVALVALAVLVALAALMVLEGIQDNFVSFLSSLAGANGEKVAGMPTWRGQTLPMEEVLVVPSRVRSASSLLNQAGASTATSAGMSTSPD